jgi:predicted SnoaL-like aldol condensation-catalyzing enzyme
LFGEQFFKNSPRAYFETEEIIAAGNRCVVRWIYRWEKEGKEGYIRGIDLFKVKDGKVAEKFSYVKG